MHRFSLGVSVLLNGGCAPLATLRFALQHVETQLKAHFAKLWSARGKATALAGWWVWCLILREDRATLGLTFPSLPKRWLDRHRTPKLREICRGLRAHRRLCGEASMRVGIVALRQLDRIHVDDHHRRLDVAANGIRLSVRNQRKEKESKNR